ncbi:glucose 1-dehydrogenase [Pseudomaricurvus alkylphenolicus]|uniref:SDR family NAD(P)-dependent oxidoreductase n=1 Tax=Pseudomaricurvus alkylphenolicus TaxID=1306991 RepID=UPI001423F9F1|nr:glucose 1-dehydrogenase [Pseudomaricurvus alkylphenolicus]NIB38951.1 glucose 1-dehydrogenase [Pseudomaricurvus alkylphenolicus]
MISLTGKVAIITGAARGQGAAEARLFSELGAKVVVADVLTDEGQQLAADIGDNAVFHPLDVTSTQQWQETVKFTLKTFGKLDVLVNNAGIAPPAMLEDISDELYMNVVSVNQLGVILGMRTVIPAMKDNQGGSIINIASTAAMRGVPRSIAYCSTKWAVRGMTKTAAMELGRYGIRVNSVHPGAIDTAMVEWEKRSDKERRAIVGGLPISRIGSPHEVAQTVAFLASDASAYSTGAEYIVDGGSLAGNPLFG